METQVSFDPDELILFKEDEVTGSSRSAEWGSYYGELTLTNKKIVYVKKGVLGSVKGTEVYPLAKLQVTNRFPQVGKNKNSNGKMYLDLYFLFGEKTFYFESNDEETIDKWIKKIRALFGCDAKVCPNCGASVDFHLLFCPECGAPLKKESPLAERQPAAQPSGQASAAAAQPQPQPQPQPQESTPPVEKLPIEKQITILRDLKSLLDAGILSQEEFEKKKKEIL